MKMSGILSCDNYEQQPPVFKFEANKEVLKTAVQYVH